MSAPVHEHHGNFLGVGGREIRVLQNIQLNKLYWDVRQGSAHLGDHRLGLLTEVAPGLADEGELNRTHTFSLRGDASTLGQTPGTRKARFPAPERT